ncbi:MAG: site-specific integrase [Chloroflexi bacterium]|nr:site-specific integrase [Chloroflexota bacterium]
MEARAGRGSITWRTNGKGERVGYCQVMLGYGELGTRIRRSVNGKTEREIDKKVRKLLAEYEAGTLPSRDAERETVGAYLDRWLVAKRGTIEPQSWRRHENNVNLHIKPAVGTIKLSALQPDHLRALYAGKVAEGYSPRTVKYIHTSIHQALEQAVDDGRLPRNVAARVKTPKLGHHEVQALTPIEMKRLFEISAEHRLAALSVTAFYLGCREGELLALMWSDIDWKARTATVQRNLVSTQNGAPAFSSPKTRAGVRTIPIPATALRAPQDHRDRQRIERKSAGAAYRDHGLVFCTPYGTPLVARNVIRLFESFRGRIGLPATVTFHALRHTAASMRLAAGVSLPEVAQILGHATPQVTATIYAHMIGRSTHQSAELMEQWVEDWKQHHQERTGTDS